MLAAGAEGPKRAALGGAWSPHGAPARASTETPFPMSCPPSDGATTIGSSAARVASSIAAKRAAAAYIASRAKSADLCRRLYPGYSNNADHDGGSLAAAVQAHNAVVRDADRVAFDHTRHGDQKALSDAVDSASLDGLLAGATLVGKAHLSLVQAPGAAAWLKAECGARLTRSVLRPSGVHSLLLSLCAHQPTEAARAALARALPTIRQIPTCTATPPRTSRSSKPASRYGGSPSTLPPWRRRCSWPPFAASRARVCYSRCGRRCAY